MLEPGWEDWDICKERFSTGDGGQTTQNQLQAVLGRPAGVQGNSLGFRMPRAALPAPEVGLAWLIGMPDLADSSGPRLEPPPSADALAGAAPLPRFGSRAGGVGHWPAGLLLDDGRPVHGPLFLANVQHPQPAQVTAPQLAVDGQVEEGQVPSVPGQSWADTDALDLSELQQRLLPSGFALKPGLPTHDCR